MRHHPCAVPAATPWLIGALGLCLACAGAHGGATATLTPTNGLTQAASSAAGIKLVASAALGTLAIRKWRLENGLDIITVPDADARSLSYVTTFRVGSRDENAATGQTGLAHLCEHLMFAGTSTGHPAGEFDQRLEEAGGSANAVTSYDFTSYVDDIPPALLERTIGLEADRMLNLALSPAAVASERDIVIEERLQSSQDDVDGELEELVYGQAFRAHPYRWPVIGRMADIKAATKDSVCDFYRRNYGPGRAVIVLAGRFDEATALPLLAAGYGHLPVGGATTPATIEPERAPEREVRATILRPVPADRFMIGFPAPGLGDPDRAAYELLDELMTGGPSARIYRALIVERELASSLDSEVAATRDPGLWTLIVQMTKGQPAASGEEVIRRELERLIAEPAAQSELEAARNRLETAFWQALSSSQGRAEALGHYDVTTGDFRTLLERGAAYARLSPAEVSRVARVYLASGARSVVVAHPQSAAKGAVSE